jgi:membrane protein implicated in regulation of membrane protease activity
MTKIDTNNPFVLIIAIILTVAILIFLPAFFVWLAYGLIALLTTLQPLTYWQISLVVFLTECCFAPFCTHANKR